MIEDYIAPDGGGMLDLNDKAVLDGQATTANQNGVLYLAYMMRSCGKTVELIKAAYLHHSIVSVGKGRLLRRKGDHLRQSHDNVLAWAWLSVWLNQSSWAKEIYDFAKWRLCVYQPASYYSLDRRCLLQPSQIFTLLLAANRRPGWLSTLWFCGSCLVSDHASGPYLLSMLATDIVQARWALLSPLKQKLVTWAMGLMMKRRGNEAQWYQGYYQDQQNPAVLAAIRETLNRRGTEL